MSGSFLASLGTLGFLSVGTSPGWTIYILVVGTDKGTMREQIPEGLFWSELCVFVSPRKPKPPWVDGIEYLVEFVRPGLKPYILLPLSSSPNCLMRTSRHVVMCQSEFLVLIIVCVNCSEPQMTSLELLRSKLLTRIPHGGLKESTSMWKELIPEPFLGEILIHLPILSSIMKDIIQPPCWKVEGIHSWR